MPQAALRFHSPAGDIVRAETDCLE